MKSFTSDSLKARLRKLDWRTLTLNVLEKGFAVTESFLNSDECNLIKSFFLEDELFRSTIDMKRYNFGKGQDLA